MTRREVHGSTRSSDDVVEAISDFEVFKTFFKNEGNLIKAKTRKIQDNETFFGCLS